MTAPRTPASRPRPTQRLRDALLAMAKLSTGCASETAPGSRDGALSTGGAAGAAGSGTGCDGDPSNPNADSEGGACYVAPAVDGVATCLPFDDPSLPSLLSYSAQLGNAVFVKYVIAAAGQTPLSTSYVARAHCCEEQGDIIDRQTCLAPVRGLPAPASCEGLAGGLHGGPYACGPPADPPLGERARRCYQTCGSRYSVGRPLLAGEGAIVAALVPRADWQES